MNTIGSMIFVLMTLQSTRISPKLVLAGTAFDAIWAIALGLHNASERVRMNDSSGCEDYPGELVPLEEFNYRNKMMGCVFWRSLGNVKLGGITVS